MGKREWLDNHAAALHSGKWGQVLSIWFDEPQDADQPWERRRADRARYISPRVHGAYHAILRDVPRSLTNSLSMLDSAINICYLTYANRRALMLY
jgi:hypothetical protein